MLTNKNMEYQIIIGDRIIEKDQVNLGKRSWPEFMQHDSIVEAQWSRLYTDFLDFQFAAYSENGIVGVGNSVPIHLEGDISNLPNNGIDWAMLKAVDDIQKKLTPNLLVGIQILINPELQSKGLSYKFLDLMKQVASTHGISNIAIPVRPTQKHFYPLMPMEEYLEKTNPKGEPFDPWIRVHIKAGGKINSICPESMIIKGTVDEWQAWTGTSFERSGTYTIEKALCPIHIDLGKNIGEYIEPNVWIIHSI